MKIKLGNNEYNHIYIILIAYWLILLFWQNYGGAFNHSSIDIVIKIILIMSLSIYYFLHSKTVLKINVFSFISFAFCILICFFNDSNGTGEIIDYLYPVLFIFISLILGNRFQIAHNEFLILCRIIIFANLYMCIYAVLFCREQFISAFSISQAYGNELKSFLYSNHEYGLYLLYGIVCCIILLKNSSDTVLAKKIIIYLLMALFSINLILTYSRTSLLGLLLFTFSYLILNKKSYKQLVFYILIAGALIYIITNPTINKFLISIVLKNNYNAGRYSLMSISLGYFKDGNVLQKLFGHGVGSTDQFFNIETGHSSSHNAYLQVLCCYGLIILLMLLVYYFYQLFMSIRMMNYNRFMGSVFASVMLACAGMMFTNTTLVFSSTIDSYFMTLICIIIPKYYRNYIYNEKE